MIITNDIYDQYGNFIDSRRETDEGVPGNAETIQFNCSPADAGFWDGAAYATTMESPVSEGGEASVLFRASPYIGTNIILIEPPAGIPPRWLSIPGTGTLEPCSITVSIQPNVDTPPYVRADGTSRFYLTYALADHLGNPACNSSVTITTSEAGELYSSRTNSDGQILITYGPRDRTGIITITARSVVNASVSVSREVGFVSMDGCDMLVTASPQVMASHDVCDTLVAEVRAKVMDIKGNPVEGETVEFQIVNCLDDAAQVSPPALQSASAVTNADGYAIVDFVPGTFETDWREAWYTVSGLLHGRQMRPKISNILTDGSGSGRRGNRIF
ncbi:MAG: hypothetical protein APR53_07930 [Methanoculleus sp. SDB]|nr:MAG: hypothetical protein APR53_07930 [Methanoculleus sp. SDB]